MLLHKDAKVELLKQVPLFERLSKRELREIATLADVLVEGAADVRRRGRKINTLGSGDFLGEIALITGTPRTATVTTTAGSRLLVITSSAFRRLMREMPSIQEKVLAALAARIPDDLH